MNCAYNAVSALGRAKYGVIAEQPGARAVLRRIVEETVAVARAARVRLPEAGLLEAVFQLGVAMSQATSLLFSTFRGWCA